MRRRAPLSQEHAGEVLTKAAWQHQKGPDSNFKPVVFGTGRLLMHSAVFVSTALPTSWAIGGGGRREMFGTLQQNPSTLCPQASLKF